MSTLVFLMVSGFLALTIALLDVFVKRQSFLESVSVFVTRSEHFYTSAYIIIWLFSLLWSMATDYRIFMSRRRKDRNNSNGW